MVKQHRKRRQRDPWKVREASLRKLGFKDYGAYLESKLWKKTRKRAFRAYGGLCSFCGERAKQIHHNSYALGVMQGKDLTQLMPVCRACHEEGSKDAAGWVLRPAAATKKMQRTAKVKAKKLAAEKKVTKRAKARKARSPQCAKPRVINLDGGRVDRREEGRNLGAKIIQARAEHAKRRRRRLSAAAPVPAKAKQREAVSRETQKCQDLRRKVEALLLAAKQLPASKAGMRRRVENRAAWMLAGLPADDGALEDLKTRQQAPIGRQSARDETDRDRRKRERKRPRRQLSRVAKRAISRRRKRAKKELDGGSGVY